MEILCEAMRWEDFLRLLAKVESFVPLSPFSIVAKPLKLPSTRLIFARG